MQSQQNLIDYSGQSLSLLDLSDTNISKEHNKGVAANKMFRSSGHFKKNGQSNNKTVLQHAGKSKTPRNDICLASAISSNNYDLTLDSQLELFAHLDMAQTSNISQFDNNTQHSQSISTTN